MSPSECSCPYGPLRGNSITALQSRRCSALQRETSILFASKDESTFGIIRRQHWVLSHTTLRHTHTNILSCTFWKFLLSVARPIKVSGLLWVDSVLTVLISWAANAGLTNVFEFLCYRSPDSCRGHEDAGRETASLYECIFSALGFPEFSPPAYSDWLLVLHPLLFIHSVLIWLTALQINSLTSFLLLSLIRTEYSPNSLSIQVCVHGTCKTAETMHAWTPIC